MTAATDAESLELGEVTEAPVPDAAPKPGVDLRRIAPVRLRLAGRVLFAPVRRFWAGLLTAPGEWWWWRQGGRHVLAAQTATRRLADAARDSGGAVTPADEKAFHEAEAQRASVAADRRVLERSVLVGLVVLSLSWWCVPVRLNRISFQLSVVPATLFLVASVAFLSTLTVHTAARGTKNQRGRDQHVTHATDSAAIWCMQALIGAVASIAVIVVTRVAGIPEMVIPAATWTAITIWLIVALGDGTIADNLPGNPPAVDEVTPGAETAGDIVAALAAALKVKPQDATRAFTVVGSSEPAWDDAHRWRTLTIQMANKTVDDTNRVKTAVAGLLRIPADWLILDEGANAAQVVVRWAVESPWPTEPTRAPALDTRRGDVWKPQRIGLDLLGTTPQEILLSASSIGIGGDTGTGKTALWRLLAFLILADPRAVLDAWDFKGDGALSMFKDHAEEYGAGDAEDIAEAFRDYLLARKCDLIRRVKVLEQLAEQDRGEVRDAKVTRELAHRRDIDLRPRFVMIDEVQNALEDPTYGAEILELLIYLAKKGRSGGFKLILATQTWDRGTIPARLANVISTRISLRQPNHHASAQTLGSCPYRADLLPNVPGAAVIHPKGDGAALARPVRVILDYADALETETALALLGQLRRTAGATPARLDRPECPPILAAMHELLSEPGRDGRMRSLDMASALAEQGLLPELSDEFDARARTQQLADLVRPYGVRPRPDRGNPDSPNVSTYWLDKVDNRRGDQVGVGPAMRQFAPPEGASQSASHTGDAVSPGGSPKVVPIRRTSNRP